MKRCMSFILVLCLLLSLPVIASAKTPFYENSKAIAEAAESVVMLTCYDKEGFALSTGSGFLALDDGVIITNQHVLGEDAAFVQAKTEDGMSFDIDEVLCFDVDNDIAILKTFARTRLPLLSFDFTDSLVKGARVIAIGSPLGLLNTVTEGIYSGLIFDKREYVLFSAAISGGSSGGALFNEDGKVIAMTSASYIDGQNLNLAVPSKSIISLWESYQKGKQQEHDIKMSEYYSLFVHEESLEQAGPQCTVGEVLSNPSDYDGKMITLCGYVYKYALSDSSIALVDNLDVLDKFRAHSEQYKNYYSMVEPMRILFEMEEKYCIIVNFSEEIDMSRFEDGDYICINGIVDKTGNSWGVKQLNFAQIV